jgi:hypothetical protein
MSVNLDFGEDLLDQSIFPDYKGRAFETHDAVIGRQPPVGIGQKRHIQLIFIAEFGLPADAIGAGSYCDRLPFFDLCFCVTEPVCLARSTGGVGFGIKEKNHGLLSRIIAQFQCVAMIVLERKIWGFAPFLRHRILPLF